MALIRGKRATGEIIDHLDGVTDGSDTIIGNPGNDIIFAGGGNDVIKGGGGADYIDGGAGRDRASYEDSAAGVTVDLVTGKGKGGDAEGDVLTGIEDLWGSQHADTLTGDGNDNTLCGLGGNDTLKGGGGADTLNGGLGDDVLDVDGKDDKVSGGDGVDTLFISGDHGVSVHLQAGYLGQNGIDYGSAWMRQGKLWSNPDAADSISGVENVIGSDYGDDIYGSNGANELLGGGGNDYIHGLAGDDVLHGGSGEDVLIGGQGADILSGGTGMDFFHFKSAAESLVVNGRPQDTILDFQGGLDQLGILFGHAEADLLVLNNRSVDGANCAVVGIDANHNGAFDDGEFAVAVRMTAGTTFDTGWIV